MAEKWFNKSVEETEKLLNTDLAKGLNDQEVLKRREKYGLNELEAGKTYSTTLRTSSLNEVAQVVITVVNNEGESITINKLNPNQ